MREIEFQHKELLAKEVETEGEVDGSVLSDVDPKHGEY